MTISNAGSAPAAGAVTVTEAVPTGFSLVSMSGAGWTCAANTCARSDALATGGAYPPLTITVAVTATATSPQVNTVSVAGGGSVAGIASDSTVVSPSGLALYPVTPCRVADTRNPSGPAGGPAMAANSTRVFTIAGPGCGIPASAQAYSLSITAVPSGTLNYLTAWPTGLNQPYISTLNSSNGAVIANAAIVPAGVNGSISIFVTDAANVVIDINGYFAPPGGAGGLAFYPATPCRVADTRNANGPSGGPSLPAGGARNFTPPSSGCGIPGTAQAYSLNITAVPGGPLGWLTVWPAGQPQPYVSTLNAQQGQIAASAAIVPAGVNGAISVFASDATNVIVDINGYFAPPGSPGALWFYPVAPCRTVDTRFDNPVSTLSAGATSDFALPATSCGLPSTALAYSLNMTAEPVMVALHLLPLFYLTTWPSGHAQPLVSTLNDLQGQVIANAAIVPAGTAGAISVFVSDTTDLIIDVNGYFGH